MLITTKHLKSACRDQIDLFNKTFPDGAEFNKPNWDLALGVGLQVMWMERFLDESNKKIYNETTESARKIYYDTIEPARKIYYETIEPVQKIYNEAIAPARKIYNEAIAPALKIHNDATSPVLFNALEKQFSTKKKLPRSLMEYLKCLIRF